MAHKLRKKFHADVQDKWIRELDDKSAVCILDYKMKFLGLTCRQAQGEMIGKSGTSIHILYFLVKKPDDFSVSAARDGDGMGVVAIADKDFWWSRTGSCVMTISRTIFIPWQALRCRHSQT